ncbi:MAG: 3'-5' exonuclease, partial [Myxococcota bacterium]
LLASIARTLLAEGPTLDIAHKVAGIVRQQLRGESALTGAEETWAERPLPDLADIKRVIAELRASNRQRSLVPNAEDLTPPQPGQVQVLTLHRSKGAEFDAVWIPDLGAYTIPRKGTMSRFPWDTSEVNLMGQKGLIAQAAVERFAKGEPLDEAAILESARQEAVSEKLRLLYVGITRAERFLTLSCNTYEGRVDPPRHIQELARLCQQ